MLKYEFKNTGGDNHELIYKKGEEEKRIPFTTSVAIVSKLQGITARAEMLLNVELTSMGLTQNDLIIKKQNGSKIIEDRTNLNAMIRKYQEKAGLQILEECSQMCFGMDLYSILEELEFNENDTEQAIKFGEEFTKILASAKQKTPSN